MLGQRIARRQDGFGEPIRIDQRNLQMGR
jgi:hypothetical protein